VKDSEWILNFAFLVPGIIGIVQVALGLVYFDKETPRYLQENGDEETCVKELAFIYSSVERRTDEFEKMFNRSIEIKYQYPSYKELISESYLSSTLKGITAIVLRNFTGGFSMALFGGIIYKDEAQVNASTILDSIVTLVSIAPFFYIKCILYLTISYWFKTSLSHWLYWRIHHLHLCLCVAIVECVRRCWDKYCSNKCC
jgi:hypothetical protein